MYERQHGEWRLFLLPSREKVADEAGRMSGRAGVSSVRHAVANASANPSSGASRHLLPQGEKEEG
jgi:hypothetical protein